MDPTSRSRPPFISTTAPRLTDTAGHLVLHRSPLFCAFAYAFAMGLDPVPPRARRSAYSQLLARTEESAFLAVELATVPMPVTDTALAFRTFRPDLPDFDAYVVKHIGRKLTEDAIGSLRRLFGDGTAAAPGFHSGGVVSGAGEVLGDERTAILSPGEFMLYSKPCPIKVDPITCEEFNARGGWGKWADVERTLNEPGHGLLPPAQANSLEDLDDMGRRIAEGHFDCGGRYRLAPARMENYGNVHEVQVTNTDPGEPPKTLEDIERRLQSMLAPRKPITQADIDAMEEGSVKNIDLDGCASQEKAARISAIDSEMKAARLYLKGEDGQFRDVGRVTHLQIETNPSGPGHDALRDRFVGWDKGDAT